MARPRRARVQLMFGRGGGGHLASARAVRDALAASGRRADVALVDAAALVGAAWCDRLYNSILAAGALPLVGVMHAGAEVLLPLTSGRMRREFAAWWGAGGGGAGVDVVVSFVPRLNVVMQEAAEAVWAAEGRRGVFLTVLTDFSTSREHPWVQSDAQWVVAGTQAAYDEAARLFPRARRTRTSGMVVHPRFYGCAPPPVFPPPPAAAPRRTTALLLFGADPPTAVVMRLVRAYWACADAAGARGAGVDLIVVCGRNEALRAELEGAMAARGCANYFLEQQPAHRHAAVADVVEVRRIGGDGGGSGDGDSAQAAGAREEPGSALEAVRMYVTGFTSNVAGLMRCADVLVGKPGPGVVSEAYVSGLPCVLLTGGGVMAQEEAVVDWVVAAGVGAAVDAPEDAAAVGPQQIRAMRAAIASGPPNRAVFEVADLVAGEIERLHGAAHLDGPCRACVPAECDDGCSSVSEDENAPAAAQGATGIPRSSPMADELAKVNETIAIVERAASHRVLS